MCRVQQVARPSELRLDEHNNPAVAASIMLVARVARANGNIIKLHPSLHCCKKMPARQARESDDGTRF